jgi:hypothetical protein
MVWLLRLLSAVAAAVTSLFVARDALNFGIIETLLIITLIVGAAVIAVAVMLPVGFIIASLLRKRHDHRIAGPGLVSVL